MGPVAQDEQGEGSGCPSQGPPGPAPGQCCNKGTGRAGFHRPPVPLLLSSSWAAGVGDGGSEPGVYRLVTPVVGQSGPAWSVQTCYAGAGRPSQGPPGPAPGQCCNKGTGRAGFHRPPVPLLLSSSWAAGVGDGGSEPGAYRLVTPAAGNGLVWGVQTCYAGAGRPSQEPPGPAPGQCCNKGTGRAGFLRPPVPLLLSSSWAAGVGDGESRPGAYRLVTLAAGNGLAWGVQTCYAGGGRVRTGPGRTDLLRRRWASRGRPGAYRVVTLMGLLWRPALARPLGGEALPGRVRGGTAAGILCSWGPPRDMRPGDIWPWKPPGNASYNDPYGTHYPVGRPGPKMPARPAPEVFRCSRRASPTAGATGPVSK